MHCKSYTAVNTKYCCFYIFVRIFFDIYFCIFLFYRFKSTILGRKPAFVFMRRWHLANCSYRFTCHIDVLLISCCPSCGTLYQTGDNASLDQQWRSITFSVSAFFSSPYLLLFVILFFVLFLSLGRYFLSNIRCVRFSRKQFWIRVRLIQSSRAPKSSKYPWQDQLFHKLLETYKR